MSPRRTYPTYDMAAVRVERLKAQGIWPGIVGPDASGWYWLTFDPQEGGGQS